MVNQWMLTSYGGYGGWGLVTRGAVLPTYYTYQMYQHLGDELLLSSSDDPFITITAAKRDDGTLTLLVINLKDEPVVKPIQIKGLSPIQEAETWLLDLAHNAENLGMQSIPVDGLHLPGQSITFLIISP